MSRLLITAERLRELLHYDAETGVFRWKVRPYRTSIQSGTVAGMIYAGYRRIRVDGQMYQAHRLAWFYIHGHWPVNLIDHKNTIRDDNRLSNLREATRAENVQIHQIFQI